MGFIHQPKERNTSTVQFGYDTVYHNLTDLFYGVHFCKAFHVVSFGALKSC